MYKKNKEPTPQNELKELLTYDKMNVINEFIRTIKKNKNKRKE